MFQFASGVGAVLRDHDTAQPTVAPGGLEDGRAAGRRTAEDGGAAAAQQRQVPGHCDGLSADPSLRQPGEQADHTGESGAGRARQDHEELRLREAVVDHFTGAKRYSRLFLSFGHLGTDPLPN